MVMGAGAVGGYYGARLQAAGHEVTFVARGEHLRAMQEHGLRIHSIDGDLHLQVTANSDPSSSGEMDLILFTVKSQDTETALDLMSNNIGLDTVVLTLQNGVENEDKIAARYGFERTLGGVTYIGITVQEPGVIKHDALGRIAMGRMDAHSPDISRVREIAATLQGAGIPVSIAESIMTRKWGKLVWNAAFNPVSVLTGLTTHAMTSSPDLRSTLVGIMKEVIQVANAEGYPLDESSILDRTFRLTTDVSDVKTSMLQDHEHGKPLEIDALNGVVVRKAADHGTQVPLNTAIYGMIRGKLQSGTS